MLKDSVKMMEFSVMWNNTSTDMLNLMPLLDIPGLIITVIITILVTLFFTVISIRYTKKYSSVYHVKENNIAKEKYRVSEKVELHTKDQIKDSARILLEKSSFYNAMGFMDVSLTDNSEEIIIDRYAFIHSCIHNIISPGKEILKSKPSWNETVKSNEFTYQIRNTRTDKVPINLIQTIPTKVRNMVSTCVLIKSEFDYPKVYTGPRHRKRLIIMAKGIGIVYSKTEYANGDTDCYILNNYKTKEGNDYWLPFNKVGNWWEYDIIYEHGPNKVNISE